MFRFKFEAYLEKRYSDGLLLTQVYAVVVSHPPIGDLSPAAVSYTSGFYHIPVIGISSRDSAFSDKVTNLETACSIVQNDGEKK